MNGRRAKLSGLNTDHESAPSPVVADETRVCLCAVSLLQQFSRKTNERLFVIQLRSIMEPLDLTFLSPELWYQQVNKLHRSSGPITS